MSHVYAYGLLALKAKSIIHLGATSCYVGDNTDIIIMQKALILIRKKLVSLIALLSSFADKYKSLPTLGFTHFQSAQPTTVGKRATLWTWEFMNRPSESDRKLSSAPPLGSKGTTAHRQAFWIFLTATMTRCARLDKMIAEKMGFPGVYPVSGRPIQERSTISFCRCSPASRRAQ